MNEELFNNKESSFVSEVCNEESSEDIVLKNQNLFQQCLQSHTKKSPSLSMNEGLFNDEKPMSLVSQVSNNEFPEHTVLTDQDYISQQYLHSKEGSQSRTKERSHVCQICNKEFSMKSKLDFHFLIHTRPFICEVCNQTFSRNSHLKDHIRVHTGEKPYICETCHKEFPKKENLTKHLRVHTKEKNHVCEICNKRFSQKCNLTTHLLIHTNKKDHVCQACNKRFYRKANLDEHIRVHTKEKSFICEICSRAFSHKSALNMHFRLHTKEKAFICEICNKAFTHKLSLNLHYEAHSKVKSFVCGICSKAFSHKITLKKHHLQSHTNAELSEPIVLNDQDNFFQQYPQSHTKISPSLSMNEELLNNKESTSFDSEVCNENNSEHFVLKDQDNLFQEYLQSHPKNSPSSKIEEELSNNKEPTSVVSEVCNEEFSEHIALKYKDNLFQQYLESRTKNSPSSKINEEILNNKESTTFVSGVFNEGFSENKFLTDQDHVFQQYLHSKERSHSRKKDRSYVCQECNKEFPTKSKLDFHFLIHTRPFICEVCNQTFSRNSHLIDHLRVHTGEKPYFCEICHKRFSKKENLTKHFRVHTKEKNHICEICNKGFSQKSNLTAHLITHTNKKDHVCQACNKRFYRKSHLDEHIKVHTQEKSFICGICSRAFNHKSALNMHFRLHTKEKAFICEICNKAFTHKSSLNLHYQVHSKVKSFVCEICNKAFSHKITLKKHHLRIHINAEFSERIVLKDQDNLFQQYFPNPSEISPSLSMNEELFDNKESTSFVSEISNEEFPEHVVLKDQDHPSQQYLQNRTKNSPSLSMNEELFNSKQSTSFGSETCNEEFSKSIGLSFSTLPSPGVNMNEELIKDKEPTSFASKACNEELSEHTVLKDQDHLFQQYPQTHTRKSLSFMRNEKLSNDKEPTSFASKACNEELSEHTVLKDQDNFFQQYPQTHTKKSLSLMRNEDLFMYNDKESTSFVSEVSNEEFSEHLVVKDQDHPLQQLLQIRTKNSQSLSMNNEELLNKESTSFISEISNAEF